jgi:ornithine cyclodeaminase
MIHMLVLTQKDIRQLYTMQDCLRDVEQVFRDNAAGLVHTPVRTAIDHPKYGATSLYMPSYLEASDYVAVKVISIFPENHAAGIKALQSVILLTEAKTGQHVAMMDASYLTVLRTGASSGVATKYLAREQAKSCAVLGCGAQAVGQIQAVMEVRALEEVVLYNRTIARAEEMEKILRTLYPDWTGEIRIVENADQAVKNADIVICSTKSESPLFDGASLKPGAHINAIGAFLPHMREVDLTTLQRCSKIVVDTIEGSHHEAGDLLIPVSRGEWSFDQLHAELGEILLGHKKGRENEEEITLYKSVGIAYLDTAVAKSVYELAKDKGMGTEIVL